jgi:DNA-binding FadR family transcriptional regulator
VGLTGRPTAGRNLTHGLLDILGRDIVIGAFVHRTFPTEAELARDFAVSRSVTREAIKMLTAKGLLTARPRQGTIVQPESSWNLFDADVLRWLLDRKSSASLLRHFTELRVSIEPAAAALAARAASPAAIREIEAGYRRMIAAEQDPGDTLDADIAFHVAILNASGNPFYAQFRDVVKTALHTSIRFTNDVRGHGASLPTHRAVLDAIRAGDSAAAQAAMTLIVRDVAFLLEAIERGDPQSHAA